MKPKMCAWLGLFFIWIGAGPGVAGTLAYTGVNLSGAEFGEALPGTYGFDYTYPLQSEVDYFRNKGMNIVRLPFAWERLQRSANAALDPGEFARLHSFVSPATAKGMYVILEPHNFARYYGNVIGSASVPLATFSNFWGRVAAIYRTNDHVFFNLVNEPNTMPTETWRDAANAALRAIRSAGATNLVLVPGNAWTGAWSWFDNWYGTPNATVMRGIVDPANHFAFEAHQYLDSDGSGTSPACVSATIGAERLASFTAWCRTYGYRAFLGEFSGSGNATCLLALRNLLSFVDANTDVWLGWTFWSAGPWWGDYMFSLEPKNGADATQMAVLDDHFVIPQPRLLMPNPSTLRFQALRGYVYQVEASPSLLPAHWTNYRAAIVGAAQTVTMPTGFGAKAQEFYRARVTRAP